MYNHSNTADVVQRRKKRSRNPIACSACRKRKIKCQVDHQSYSNPCYRCVQLNLPCEYIPISEDPEAASLSGGSSQPSPIPDQKLSTSIIPSDNRTSYFHRSPHQPEHATTYFTSDPVPGTSQMIDPGTSALLYRQNYVQPAQRSGSPAIQTFPHTADYIHRPVPESVVHEAANMQTFMALSRSSSTFPRQEDPDLQIILQQMYQPSSLFPVKKTVSIKCRRAFDGLIGW
ncbi:hypothetical protein C8J56DRAFT_897080 [Mycena floridula]|nr:hypothetical protein C8J56DRAFT_897080 [Mycena floridula]